MKRKMNLLFFLSLFTLVIFTGCTSEIENEPKNTDEINTIINQIADKYIDCWNNKNLEALDSMIANDGQFYGSDPNEIMDKTGLFEMYTAFFADTTSDYQYNVNLRKIKIALNKSTAIVMERITFPAWSPKMPMCQTTQFINLDGVWKIDFISWGFIIANDDVPMLNQALD